MVLVKCVAALEVYIADAFTVGSSHLPFHDLPSSPSSSLRLQRAVQERALGVLKQKKMYVAAFGLPAHFQLC